MWHAQANARDGGAERINILPINVRGDARLLTGESVNPAVGEAESAQNSSGANIDGNEAHRPLHKVEDHIIGAHDLATIDINDLLVE